VNQQANRGIGTLLIAIYAVFAVSATARASYQLATKFNDAPIAYSFSALSALIYIVATVSLAKKSARAARIARAAVIFELVGVIAVGTLSFAIPELFQHPTVWSWFGLNYACLPLVLPIFGLLWLNKRRAAK
jgi:cytochrome bd-type quinol oxidase subunit 2